METIKLDLIPGKKMPSLHASQYDEGRDYHIDLTENRVPYELDGTEVLSLEIRKCDNTLCTMDIANSFGGKKYIEFRTTEQMNACAGFNYGEIKLEKNGVRIGSLNFYLQVEGAPDEGGITSQSEINNLNRQVHDIVAEELADNGAEETGYDNTESGLDATNVQDAIDEVNTKIENIPSVDAYTKQESDEKYATKTELEDKADVSALATKADASTVTAISNKLNDVTEGETSRNIFDSSFLEEATGITYSNGVFEGAASDFNNAGHLTGIFAEGKRYVAQVVARKKSGATTTGNGLIIRFKYSDGTYFSTYMPNSTTSFTQFTLVSDEGKDVTEFWFPYASGGPNVWEVKNIQIEEGTTPTPYMPPEASTLTAIDKVARTKINELPWWSRFQNEFLRIAYSAIWVDKINTAVHWLFASDMGFNVLKGDVEITSDGELVMCHDPGFTFDENGRIINYDSSNKTLIVDMTYAECRSKFYADNPQRYGGYCPVADVDDFIRICKDKGKICFLTIRATNTASVVAKALEKIRYYGMESRTILNAVQLSIIDVIRENHDADGIAVNFVAPEGQAITTAQVDKCVEWGNAFLSIWADGVTSVIDNSATAIAYAKQKNVPLLAAVSGDVSFWNYLIKKGIMGYQITKPIFDVEPKSQRFAVKMTSGTPTFENLFASNRFTATVSVSGLRIYVSDVCITDSYLTNVIDGIQPIKMNMLNPDIKCFDTSGNSYTCVWSSAHNRFEITIPDTNDRTYRVLVTV